MTCDWSDCPNAEGLQTVPLWGTRYCPAHIDRARYHAAIAKKGPAFTDRIRSTDPRQLQLIGGEPS